MPGVSSRKTCTGTSGRCLLCLVVEFQPVRNTLANPSNWKNLNPPISRGEHLKKMFELPLLPENLYKNISSCSPYPCPCPQKNTTVKYIYAKNPFFKKKQKSKHGGFTNIPSNLSRIQESAASSKTQKKLQAAEHTPPSFAEQVACKGSVQPYVLLIDG